MNTDGYHVYESQQQPINIENGTLPAPHAARLDAMRDDLADRQAHAAATGQPIPTTMRDLYEDQLPANAFGTQRRTQLERLNPAHPRNPHHRELHNTIGDRDKNIIEMLDSHQDAELDHSQIAGNGLLTAIRRNRHERARRKAMSGIRSAGVLLRAGRIHTSMDNHTSIDEGHVVWDVAPGSTRTTKELTDLERSGNEGLLELKQNDPLNPVKLSDRRAVRKMRKHQHKVTHARREQHRLEDDLQGERTAFANGNLHATRSRKKLYRSYDKERHHAQHEIHKKTHDILNLATRNTPHGRRRDRSLQRHLNRAHKLKQKLENP